MFRASRSGDDASSSVLARQGIERVQALADISRLALHAIIIGRFDYSQTVSGESDKARRGFGRKHDEYSSVPNGTVPLNSHVSACIT